MEHLIGGATVGLIISQLYKAVENLIEKTNKFSKHLEAIKATVDSLKPVIDQMEKQNKELNLSNKETKKLKKIISDGIKLVGECSNNRNWYKNASYTDELTDLDEALKRQLEILMAQGQSDMKQALIRLNKEIKKLINQHQQLVLVIIVLCVCIVMFSVPGGVRKQQPASRPARSLFGTLFKPAVCCVFGYMVIEFFSTPPKNKGEKVNKTAPNKRRGRKGGRGKRPQ